MVTEVAIDPITLPLIINSLRQVATEMDLSLERSAFSPVISEAGDLASGLYRRDTGEVIVQGDAGLPIFIGVMQYTVQAVISQLGHLDEGDVAIVNDPYSGGTHVMDVRMVSPVYFQGVLFAYVANTCHWVDMGGSVPGGFGTSATEIQQEGLRLPPLKICIRGEINNDLVKIIQANIRVAELQMGDLHAQVAALRNGIRGLRAVLAKYGPDLIDECIYEMQGRSERLMRNRLKNIPSGVYSFETSLDNDGVSDEPLKVNLALRIDDDRAEFDFSGSSAACQGPLNSVIATTKSAVFIALKHLFPEIPINSGFFSPLTIIAPESTFLNAVYPRPVSGCAAEVAQRVVDSVLGALAATNLREVVAAPFGTVANVTLGGLDPMTGRRYVMYLFSGGGYGGHQGGDGLSNVPSAIGVSKTTPVELIEQRYPVMIEFYGLRVDSAGPGEHRGGMGTEYRLKLLRGNAKASVLMDRGKEAPFGVNGGSAAAAAEIELLLSGKTSRLKLLTKGDNIPLTAGDAICVRSPGGGGYGRAELRDPEQIKFDIAQGYISAKAGKQHYGANAVVDGEGQPSAKMLREKPAGVGS